MIVCGEIIMITDLFCCCICKGMHSSLKISKNIFDRNQFKLGTGFAIVMENWLCNLKVAKTRKKI